MSEIRKLAEDVSAREGCYLYDLEMVGSGNGRVLRLTIDKDVPKAVAQDASKDDPKDLNRDTPNELSGTGVSVEDCSNISRAMNLRLDVEDIVPGGPYQLEVSSPGLERVLKEPRHFQNALSRIILVKSFAPLAQFNTDLPLELAKAKQIQGPLLAYDDKGIRVGYLPAAKKGTDPLPQVEIFVPYESVTKAHVVFEFQEKLKPGQKAAGGAAASAGKVGQQK